MFESKLSLPPRLANELTQIEPLNKPLPTTELEIEVNPTSLAQKILNSKKPYVFFHTHCVTKELLQQAIDEERSMDLDVCVDGGENPYLGHSNEYYEKSGKPWDKTMSLWEAVEIIAKAAIPVMVDCKHFDAWPYIEEVIAKIGPDRCLVNTFISELRFNVDHRGPDFTCEWSSIERLHLLKSRFSLVTTSASAKWLPKDLLVSDQHRWLLQSIRRILKDNQVDTVSLNVPDITISDELLEFFLAERIIPHVKIDKVETRKFSQVYLGETDDLRLTSKA